MTGSSGSGSGAVLSISTVGGRTFNLSIGRGSSGSGSGGGDVMSELYEWFHAIEGSKLVNMNRKIEDSETSLVSLRHKVDNLEEIQMENERSYVEMKNELRASQDIVASMQQQVQQLSTDKMHLQQELRALESERLLLLKSRGVTPKRLPQWATTEDSLEDLQKLVKVWVGSWNLQGHEPFAAMERDRAKRLLKTFIPAGYDIYIIGLQECASDNVFESIDALLEHEGYRRLTGCSGKGQHSPLPMTATSQGDPSLNEMYKLYGRGKVTTFLTTIIYVRNKLASDVHILGIGNEIFSGGNDCQGALAIVVRVFGRVLAILNSELDAKSNDVRRDQYQHLFMDLGSKLGEHGYHLNEQFHHILWLGNFNHRLVDTSGNLLPVETAVTMLEDGRLHKTLFETHDELNRDKKQQLIFFNFREASPYPNFFPTYRKIRNRNPVDYTKPSWVKDTYFLSEKGSFFSGGKIKEYTPGYADRILYYSMVDLAEDFLPEALPADLEILPERRGGNGCDNNDLSRTVIAIDNYRSINDGEGMIISEHSPVFCSFLLRLQHDYNPLQLPTKPTGGDINNLLNALTIPETPQRVKNGNESTGTVVMTPSTPSNNSKATGQGQGQSLWECSSPSNDLPPPPNSISKQPGPAKLSLLPVGIYRIRLSGMKLIWGLNEISPVRASLLFPSPFESAAGERFVDFVSEPIREVSGSFSSPTAGNNTPQRNSKKIQPPTPTAANTVKNVQWRNTGPSKTGSCLSLEAARSLQDYHESGTSLPPVLLTWRGEEPLDRLHVALKVSMVTQTIRGARASSHPPGYKSNGSNTGSVDSEDDDVLVGHCALSLEQLCKIAATSPGGACSLSATRLLVSRGRPMYCVDPQSMQRELVSFHCKMELVCQ
eukprot:scaffold398_cov177-Ochromonas_danica.AAC.21